VALSIFTAGVASGLGFSAFTGVNSIGSFFSAVGSTITNAAHRENAKNPPRDSHGVAVANVNLGIAYMQHGEYSKALSRLNKAKDADPDYYAVYNALGLLYQKLTDMEQAETNYKHAISLNPSDSQSLNNYGFFLCQNNRFEEAEQSFLKAADNPLYKTPEIAITNAGTCAFNKDRPDLAEKYFRAALKKNSNVAPALIQMAELSYNNDQYLDARGYLQRYIEISGHNPKSLWLGIRIEREMGDEDVIASYTLLLRNKFPDTEEARLLEKSMIN